MVVQKGNSMEIPVRHITLDEMAATLAERFRGYETSYGVSSAEMSRRFSEGTVSETEELLRWMQAYHVHQSLKETIPTIGTLGTTT